MPSDAQDARMWDKLMSIRGLGEHQGSESYVIVLHRRRSVAELAKLSGQRALLRVPEVRRRWLAPWFTHARALVGAARGLCIGAYAILTMGFEGGF